MTEQEIIKTALLGTDKYVPDIDTISVAALGKINQLDTSKEDKFLKSSIVTLLYNEAGQQPVTVEALIAPCPAEVRPYINDIVAAQLKAALRDNEEVIFRYCTYLIQQQQAVIPGELVPPFLNKAIEQKKSVASLLNACGETGKWLSKLNKDWQPLIEETTTGDSWNTGNINARKDYLKTLHETDPQQAIILLSETFTKESANNRLALLEAIESSIQISDELFLTQLLKDKSQKVKELAIHYLRHISGTTVNEQYLQYVQSVIQIKEERNFLLSKKKVLTISDNIEPGDNLVQMGIQKLSADKNVKDNIYILGQVIASLNPDLLATRFSISAGEFIQLILKHPDVNSLMPYLSDATKYYHNKSWVLALLQSKKINDIELLNILPQPERQPFYSNFLQPNVAKLVQHLLSDSYEIIDDKLAKDILVNLAKNPYQIDSVHYKHFALQLPQKIRPSLEQYGNSTSEEYQAKYFKTQAWEMLRFMDIKQSLS